LALIRRLSRKPDIFGSTPMMLAINLDDTISTCEIVMAESPNATSLPLKHVSS
jgi:hypothetical protein